MLAPRISCIIPVWNSARFLAQALDSILAQTRRPAEIILIDDGSTDESVAIAGRYGEVVTIIRQAQQGPAAARNAGVRVASGDVLAFLDADDLWLPTKLDRQIALLAATPGADCCLTLMDVLVEDGAAVPPGLDRVRIGRVASSLMITRDGWHRVGPMDETSTIRSEVEWFGRFDAAGITTVIVEERLARRRLHRNNMSLGRRPEIIARAFAIIAQQRARGAAR